jgi:hypothetical protein
VLADKAVGADIEVWWPLDQAWYKGVVSVRCLKPIRCSILVGNCGRDVDQGREGGA